MTTLHLHIAAFFLALLLPTTITEARLNAPATDIDITTTTIPTRKTPPVWPPQLTALLKQNRGGNLSDTTLAYDWPNGRNLNIIKDLQTGSILWDNERQNGSTYYYTKETQTCNVLNMHVGILKQDWLKGAEYQGIKEVNGHHCNVWAQSSSMHHPFVTYFADVETERPWRWIFFDGAIFDVVEWTPGGTLSEEDWQLPSYCFKEEGEEEEEQEEEGEEEVISSV